MILESVTVEFVTCGDGKWEVPQNVRSLTVNEVDTTNLNRDRFIIIGSDVLEVLVIESFTGWQGGDFWKAFFIKGSFPKLHTIRTTKEANVYSFNIWFPSVKSEEHKEIIFRFPSLKRWEPYSGLGVALDLVGGFELSKCDDDHLDFFRFIIFQRLVMFKKRILLTLCYHKVLKMPLHICARFASVCGIDVEDAKNYPAEWKQAKKLLVLDGYYPIKNKTYEVVDEVLKHYKRLRDTSTLIGPLDDEDKCVLEASGTFLRKIVKSIIKKPKITL